MTSHIKIRTYSQSAEELWLDEWKNPLRVDVSIQDTTAFPSQLRQPVRYDDTESFYVDKLNTGFLVWSDKVKAYRPVGPGESPFVWEKSSQELLDAVRGVVISDTYFTQLSALLAQESSKNPTTLKLRSENVTFVKSLGMSRTFITQVSLPTKVAKMFEHHILDQALAVIEPLLMDNDRYQQRAGAEILAGVLRGMSPPQYSWEITNSSL